MRPSANHILAALVASALGTWSAGAYAVGSVDPQSTQDYQNAVTNNGYNGTFQQWIDDQVANANANLGAAQGTLASANSALAAATASYQSNLEGCFSANGTSIANCATPGAVTLADLEAAVSIANIAVSQAVTDQSAAYAAAATVHADAYAAAAADHAAAYTAAQDTRDLAVVLEVEEAQRGQARWSVR